MPRIQPRGMLCFCDAHCTLAPSGGNSDKTQSTRPGGHLLGEQRGLDAVEETFEPADQLRLRIDRVREWAVKKSG